MKTKLISAWKKAIRLQKEAADGVAYFVWFDGKDFSAAYTSPRGGATKFSDPDSYGVENEKEVDDVVDTYFEEMMRDWESDNIDRPASNYQVQYSIGDALERTGGFSSKGAAQKKADKINADWDGSNNEPHCAEVIIESDKFTASSLIYALADRGITASPEDADLAESNWIEAGVVNSGWATHPLAEMSRAEFSQFVDWCAENWTTAAR